jgi:hypothetical protein
MDVKPANQADAPFSGIAHFAMIVDKALWFAATPMVPSSEAPLQMREHNSSLVHPGISSWNSVASFCGFQTQRATRSWSFGTGTHRPVRARMAPVRSMRHAPAYM